jgi:hypothetical protein
MKRRPPMPQIEGLHKYLAGLDGFNKEIPFYVKNPFTKKQVEKLVSIIEDAKNNRPLADIPSAVDKEEYVSMDRFDPRIATHMSRMIIEFDCPKELEQVMDTYVLPTYKEEVRLGHYSYLEYDMKYGDGRHFPCLPPHIDAANTLVTFNYCLDTNIDWDIYIDNKPYSLKAGDALIFSAVNQVHWRPKREWQEGDFCKIISFDYSPLDDWRFQEDGTDPLDARFFEDRLKEYLLDLSTRKEFWSAWDLYHSLGLKIGIPDNVNGKIKNGTATDNN